MRTIKIISSGAGAANGATSAVRVTGGNAGTAGTGGVRTLVSTVRGATGAALRHTAANVRTALLTTVKSEPKSLLKVCMDDF